MGGLAIGEAASRAGIRPSALRYYERVGLLSATLRVNGRRRYELDVLRVLAVIRLAKQAGFTVAETRTLLHGFSTRTSPSKRWHTLARRKLAEMDGLIARAERMKQVLETVLRVRVPYTRRLRGSRRGRLLSGVTPGARRQLDGALIVRPNGLAP